MDYWRVFNFTRDLEMELAFLLAMLVPFSRTRGQSSYSIGDAGNRVEGDEDLLHRSARFDENLRAETVAFDSFVIARAFGNFSQFRIT